MRLAAGAKAVTLDGRHAVGAVLAVALLVVASVGQDGRPGPSLRPGAPVEGSIDETDELVDTDTLRARVGGTTRGESVRVEIAEAGVHHIDLRSHDFDAYLVLRDAEGNALAEDDDGLIGLHARLVVMLAPDQEVWVQACALHGGGGTYSLALVCGEPPVLTPAERLAAGRDDSLARLAAREAVLGPEHPDVALLLNNLAELCRQQGDLESARAHNERALAIRERVFGPVHPDVAMSLNNLGWLLYELGDYAAARPLYERALAIRNDVLGPEHPDTAQTLNNLGVLLYTTGDLAGARERYERALAIREKVLGPNDPAVGTSLNNLAALLYEEGRLAEARPLWERCVALREELYGPDHPAVATALANLAGLLRKEGRHAAARPLAERALAIRERAFGQGHPDVANSLEALGLLLVATGARAEARPRYERALAIRESVLGPNHPDVANTLQNLGALLTLDGDPDGARPLLERSVAIRERVLGPDHPDVGRSLQDLARALAAQGDNEAARSALERSLAILDATLGPEHPEAAQLLHDLADLVESDGDASAARALHERALAIRERALGPDHPLVASSLDELGGASRRQGDLRAARELFSRALSIVERATGRDDLDLALALNNLAVSLEETGRAGEARPLAERSLAIGERVLGPEHPDVATTCTTLATVLQELGELQEARRLYERALAIDEQALGPEHRDTARDLNALAGLLKLQGETDQARRLHERALAIREKALGPDHRDVALSVDNLGAFVQALGDRAGAQAYYRRALSIRERVLGPEHPDTANTLNNLGTLLIDDPAQRETARALLERALAIREVVLGPQHPGVAQTLSNLAELLRKSGDLAGARPLHERALAIKEQAHGPRHLEVAISLNNLAMLTRSDGDLAAARDLYERALGVYTGVLGPSHRDVVQCTTNLALLLVDLGERAAAFELLLASEARLAPERDLAMLSEREALAYLETLRWQCEARLCALDWGAPATQVYEGLLAWKGQVLRIARQGRERLRALTTETARRDLDRLQALQARLSRIATGHEPGADPPALILALTTERDALDRDLRAAADRTVAPRPTWDAVRAALDDGEALVDLFVQRLYQPGRNASGEPVAGSWSEPHAVAWITRADSREPQRLDLGEVGKLETAVQDFLRHEVGRQPVALNERGVTLDVDARQRPQADARGDALRRLVWDPLVPHVGDSERIFVSPDGVLATMPFEILRDREGRHLVETRSFVSLADPSLLIEIRRREPAPPAGDLVAVGGVDYERAESWPPPDARAPVLTGTIASAADSGVAGHGGGGASSTAAPVFASNLRGSWSGVWQALAGTSWESAQAIARHEATQAQHTRLVLEGASATEERIKAELPRFHLVHLATHGYFQPEGWTTASPGAAPTADPAGTLRELGLADEPIRFARTHPGLLTGLVCAGVNRGLPENRDDGYLTAEEVAWIDLGRCELAVLSACDTGLGRAQSGEGLLGLRRAFLLSGAGTVISALWSVPDQPTAEFFDLFYGNLWERGLGRHEALRTAQLELIRRNRERFDGDTRPATWGAFVLDGDWR